MLFLFRIAELTKLEIKWHDLSARSERLARSMWHAAGAGRDTLPGIGTSVRSTYFGRPPVLLWHFYFIAMGNVVFPATCTEDYNRTYAGAAAEPPAYARPEQPTALPFDPPAADPAERTGCAALDWMLGSRCPCVLRASREERVV